MSGIGEMTIRFTQASTHFLWVGALIWLGVFLVSRACIRVAATRHAVYLAGLLAMAAAFPLCFWLPGGGGPADSAEAIESTPEQVELSPVGPGDETDTAVRQTVPFDPVGFDADEDKVIKRTEPVRAEQAVRMDVWSKVSPWVSALYLGGLVAMSLRLFLGWAGSSCLRKRAELITSGPWRDAMERMQRAITANAEVALAWSREVAAPVVIGLVKPAVLLPVALASRLSPAQVEAVLAHELAHLCRRDHWAVLAQRIVETVLFFHPAVWWISRGMEGAREEACDDRVVAAGCDPADYAEALVICSECRLERAGVSARFAECLAATGPEGAPLRQRVMRLLGQGDDGNVRLGRAGWVLALLILGGVLLAVSVRGGREDLADFDFKNPLGSYEKGVKVADRNQHFELGGIHFQAGPLQWHKEGFLRLPEDQQGPGQELFLNLGTSGGYEIVEIRLFNHETREFFHTSKWQHPGDHTKDFFVERIGTTNWVRMKETGRGTFPDRMDVWLRLVTQNHGPVLILDGKEGASAKVGGSEVVITKLLPGSMNGNPGSTGEIAWDLTTVHHQDREITVDLVNRGKLLEGRYHLVAVEKDGSRHPMDNMHFRDFGRMGRHTYVQMDVALADLDHFELIPFKDRQKFFFNGLQMPRGKLLELSRSMRKRIEVWAEEVIRGELSERDFVLHLKQVGPQAVRGLIPLMSSGGTDLLAIKGAEQFLDQPAAVDYLAEVLRGIADEPAHLSPNTAHCCLILLGKSKVRRHVDLVAEFLESNTIGAIIALQEMGGDKARDHLVGAFDRIPSDKWWLLAEQLGRLGDPAAVPELKRRLATIELPPSERFPRSTVPAFTKAIADLSGAGGGSDWHSWAQGQHFVYPFDGPGTPKTFSVNPLRDHHVRLPEVDPREAAGREAIWEAMDASTEGPGFTLDGDEVVLFQGLEAMPLWEDGPPYPTTVDDWLDVTSHAELLERAKRVARGDRVRVPENGWILAVDPRDRLYVLKLEQRTADYEYGINVRPLDPLRLLVKTPSPRNAFTEWHGCTLHDLESEAKNGALDLSRLHMLTMDQARWREPGKSAVLVVEFASNQIALAVPGAEEFVLVEASRNMGSGDLIQRLARARVEAPEIDGHEKLERADAIFHRFDRLEPEQCFGIAVKMPGGGFPVAGLLEVRDIEGETLKLRTCFLRTELARGAFAPPAAEDELPGLKEHRSEEMGLRFPVPADWQQVEEEPQRQEIILRFRQPSDQLEAPATTAWLTFRMSDAGAPTSIDVDSPPGADVTEHRIFVVADCAARLTAYDIRRPRGDSVAATILHVQFAKETRSYRFTMIFETAEKAAYLELVDRICEGIAFLDGEESSVEVMDDPVPDELEMEPIKEAPLPGGQNAEAETDGVEIKWESVEIQPGDEDHPHPVLELGFAAYNRGTHRLHLPENGRSHQVEVDGQWYERVEPRIVGEDEGFNVLKGTLLLDFDPGASQLNQRIRLAANWRAIPEGKEQDYAQRQLSGYAVLPDDYRDKLVLKPGTRLVRIAVLCPPARAGVHRMIRAVSALREVNIPAGMKGAAREPADDDPGTVFKTIERFARLPKAEQANELSGFYKTLSPRTLSPAVEMILSSYPHDILQPYRDGDSYDGNTSLWAGQLEKAAKEMGIEEVAGQLEGPMWIRVATRARALQVLERHEEATAELISGDLDSRDNVALERATTIIGSLQLRRFSERLLEMWLADDERSQAAWGALVSLRDPAIVENLLERVEEESAFITRCSGLLQAPLAGKQADPLLLDLLDSPDDEIRYHAADALQECRDSELALPVTKLAAEEETRFRFLAARMIAKLPAASFKAYRGDLRKLLSDEDDEVRFQALWSFAQHKDLAAGPVVLEALRNEASNEQFKVWAMQAMAALSGQSWNYDMHHWGPESPGNREAIERFEAWVKAQADSGQ